MKLKDLCDLIIFDALPLDYDPKKRIILTHLLHIDKQILPEKMPTIMTTRIIADRFKAYCNLKGYNGLKQDNFVYVEPYTETDIVVDRRRTLKMLFCESDDLSGNLMVLIKEDNKLNYMYAGNFTDIRTAVLNETYALWTKPDSVQYLYLNLKRSVEDHLSDDIDQLKKVFNNIQNILEYHRNCGISIYIPSLGYEYFIHKLSERFRKRVALSPKFISLFNPAIDDALDHLCESIDNAKIVLFPGEPVSNDVRNNKTHNKITVSMPRKNVTKFKLEHGKYYYEVLYGPEPSPFELQMFCTLVRPKRIGGIIDTNNCQSKVPTYLIELSQGTEEYSQNQQGTELRKSTPALSEQIMATSVHVGPLSNKVKDSLFLDDSDSSD